jgi:hypothetical protein
MRSLAAEDELAKSGARTHAHSKGTACEIDARCWVGSRKLWECDAPTRRFCDQTARLAISVDLQTSSCCGSFQSAIINRHSAILNVSSVHITTRAETDVDSHRLRCGVKRAAVGGGACATRSAPRDRWRRIGKDAHAHLSRRLSSRKRDRLAKHSASHIHK